MADVDEEKKCNLEDALDAAGFGKYSIVLLISCCALISAMYMDMFSFSILMPPVACDLDLTAPQRGLLLAMPLIGVMICSYGWGISADTLGRRRTLMVAMPVGMLLNFAASLMPNYWSLLVVKFLSGAFTSSANAATFVLVGESVPQRYRSRSIFVMTTVIMMSQLILGSFLLLVNNLSFRVVIPWLGLEYRPWRLLMQIITLPGIIGCVLCWLYVKESPKFLLSKGRTEEAMRVLGTMYSKNTGNMKIYFPVTQIHVENVTDSRSKISFLRMMWNQTVPLFQPPLLKNSLVLYYLLLCACMTSTGFSMWILTLTNAYFNGNDATGKTFCQVASHSGTPRNSTITDCDHTTDIKAIYVIMIYSLSAAVQNALLSLLVGPLGMKKSTQLVFLLSILSGIAVFFVTTPILSIGLFFLFLFAALIAGNINTYLVELNPTYLRGMASCLSVVVARGFGFISVQVIAVTIADHCTTMLAGYLLLVGSGLCVSVLLPPDVKKIRHSTNTKTVQVQTQHSIETNDKQ